MAEYWEPIRDRGNDTNAVWSEHNENFKVGALTLTDHQGDVALFESRVQGRDDAEDFYDQAIDAKDANLNFLSSMNVRAVAAMRGNLEDGDMLLRELDDVNGMSNVGSGKIMARARKVATLWKKVNTARAAATPALDPLTVGEKTVSAVDTALAANEPLLKTVAEKLSGWNSMRGVVKTLATRVDKNNKRWYEAWQGEYAPGTPENDALSQIDTGPGAVGLPGIVDFTLMFDGNGNLHIDATADHATHFRELRKGPGEEVFVERAANATSPIHDPVSLPGDYTVKLQARNSSGDGPESAEKSVTVPG